MSAAIVEPKDKMRSRDVNKVARGEQAPRPVHEPGTVSKAPPPSSTNVPPADLNSNPKVEEETSSDQMRRCYDSYHEYHSGGKMRPVLHQVYSGEGKRGTRMPEPRRWQSITNQCVPIGLTSGASSETVRTYVREVLQDHIDRNTRVNSSSVAFRIGHV